MRTATKIVALVAVALAIAAVSAAALPALAAPATDQTRDQLRKRDGSCLTNTVSLQARDRTRDQLRDQTCLVTYGLGDQVQSRIRARDGSCGGCGATCISGGSQTRYGNCYGAGAGFGPNADVGLQAGSTL